MRKPEQKLWDAMRRACPPWVWLERIENLVGAGIPDVRGIGIGGREGWIELKAVPMPRRESSMLLGAAGCRVSQVGWHLRQASFGGRSYVLVRAAGHHLFLVPGRKADLINGWSVEEFAHYGIGCFEEVFLEVFG